MPKDSDYVWLRNTGQLWKVWFEVGVGLYGMLSLYVCLILLFVSFFVGFFLMWFAAGLWTLYGVLRMVEIVVLYCLLRCPACGHNPTRRKADGKMMSSHGLYSRLSKLEACPKCGDPGKGKG